MKLLITGICGYVGSRIALHFAEASPNIHIVGIDNLARRGSETNLPLLKKRGVELYHGDIRLPSDLRSLPDVEWVIDCAANPTVLAGVAANSGSTPEQLVQHNLIGTLNLLEYCRERVAGLILLSTSRVYSISSLVQLPLLERATRYELDTSRLTGHLGLSEHGIAEEFATTAPISLYGATKLASEIMAMEYSQSFNFPLWINRCGVIGGPGQFGKIDQGIFAFWVYSYALSRPLRYIGFAGSGKQVRDCLLADDLAKLLLFQTQRSSNNGPGNNAPKIVNVGGGMVGALSLQEMTQLCESYFGPKQIVSASDDETRPFDIPYYVTDNRKAQAAWGWQPQHSGEEIILHLCEWSSQNLDFVRGLFA